MMINSPTIGGDDDVYNNINKSQQQRQQQQHKLRITKQRIQRIRTIIHNLLERPSSSKAAQFISIFVFILIAVSCLSLMIQTVPQYYNQDNMLWFIIDTIIVAIFTIEFIFRLLCTPNIVQFCFDVLNLMDLVAIVPYFINFVLVDAHVNVNVISVIRVIRIFRVFKLSRHSTPIKLMTQALANSLDILYLAVVFLSVALMVSSSCVYYAERGSWDNIRRQWIRCIETDPFTDKCSSYQISPFQSIVHSIWWSLTTLTTVGYGDSYPITAWGKLVGGVTMLCGVLVIALPASLLGQKFEIEYQKHRDKERLRMQEREKLRLQQEATETKAEEIINKIVTTSGNTLRRSMSRGSHYFQSKRKSMDATRSIEMQDVSGHHSRSSSLTTVEVSPRVSQDAATVGSNEHHQNVQSQFQQPDVSKESDGNNKAKRIASALFVKASQSGSHKSTTSTTAAIAATPSSIVMCYVTIIVNGEQVMKQIIPSKGSLFLSAFVQKQVKKIVENLFIQKLTVTSEDYEIDLDNSVLLQQYADSNSHFKVRIDIQSSLSEDENTILVEQAETISPITPFDLE
jgi:hypothetical protein